MPISKDRRSLQALYPEPQAKAGMAARKPTDFRVPMVRLFVLLFTPPFAVTAVTTVYGVNSPDQSARAVNFFLYLTLLLIAVILGSVVLLYARSIIVRNCLRPLRVELLYLLLTLGVLWVAVNKVTQLFSGYAVGQVVLLEAAAYALITGIAVLAARLSSR